MQRATQDGLEWQESFLDLEPVWTREPSIGAIESISRQQLKITSDNPCTVTFHGAGFFNKFYLVRAEGSTFVMRVTLPVYPRHKTRAEVITLKWVRENTTIPAPEVFAFDDSNDNEIGFEWILIEFMQGTSAQKRWRTMSMEQKIALTERIATFQFELSGLEKQELAFKSMGTLDSPETDLEADFRAPEAAITPGRMVIPEFFKGDYLTYDIPRGPFLSTHDWLSAVLTFDEHDIEDPEDILPVAQSLLALLPKVFPPDLGRPEPSALHHHCSHLDNILVNEHGEVTAVIDWECVTALPLWMLSQVPNFLIDQPREDEPQRDAYMNETPEEAAEAADRRNDPNYLDNEGKNQLYWIHMMEYETTQLRKVYKAKLEEVCPDWVKMNPL
ncbi:hypothetical protein FOXYS1_7862 [Fusarium oxysporum]|uniref:Aminoglycoside phosphotransferase domain-containing protein n=1 Tax=Fusarium oxysporum TaxID=5507 RepID=A0A8H5A9X2_FUSOX|nr:hypothetical protein FOXYS1_7862 [Fusarium oxysporum]